jgi:hypothetical protein
VYENTFGIKGVKGYIAHKTANEEDIQKHRERGDGPNPKDIHFDMTRKQDSEWNEAALEVLLKTLREEEVDDNSIPRRSDAYLLEMLSNRFVVIQRAWKEGQSRKTPSAPKEKPKQMVKRVQKEDVDGRQAARKLQRRLGVSFYTLRIGGAPLT